MFIFDFVLLDFQNEVRGQGVSCTADPEPLNLGSGPPARLCPWNWGIFLVSLHIQEESSDLE